MVFDQLAKEVLLHMFARAGTVRTEYEVAPAPVRIDAVFARGDVGLLKESGALGALSAAVERPLLIEAVSCAVSPMRIRACVNRQHAYDQVARAEARRRKHRAPSLAHMCIVSAGRPTSAMRAYGLTPSKGLPRGFYGRSPGDAMTVVVIPELPRTRETLLLRLMGRGEVLRGALTDLMALPEGAHERAMIAKVLEKKLGLRWREWNDERWEAIMDGLSASHFDDDEDEEVVEGEDHWPDHPTPSELRALLRFAYCVAVDAPDRKMVKEVREVARQEGREQGREEGREQGREEGREQGREEGREALRTCLLTLYHDRFGAPPERVIAAVQATKGEAALLALVTLVAGAASRPVGEVHAALGVAHDG